MDRALYMAKFKEINLYLFFFLISLFPFQYTIFKLILLFLLLGISFLEILKGNRINKFYFNWFGLFLLLNFIFLNYGGIKNIEVYKTYLGGNFIWIIIYFLIFNLKVKEQTFERIGKVLEITYYIGILFLVILYINFNYFQVLDIKFIINYIRIERPGQYTKSTGFIAAITPMIFSSCFLLSKKLYEYLKNRSLKIYFILFINSIFIFITMRKILLILYPIIICLNIFLLNKKAININYQKKIIKNIVLGITFFIVIANLKFVDMSNVSNYVMKSFNYFSTEKYEGVNERKEQFYSLLDGIKKSPFLGEGIGAEVGIKRSNKVMGAYELTYVAKIFQMGILGFLLWIVLIFLLLKKTFNLYKSTQNENILSFLLATISILIVNASNPYLGSFEFDWMLYILLFLINNQNNKIK